MDIVSFTSALTGLKTAIDIIKTTSKIDTQYEFMNKISELQKIISSVTTDLLLAHSEMEKLHYKYSQIEKELNQYKNWETKKANYEPKILPPGTTVYITKKPQNSIEENMWFCANCYQNKHICILQAKDRIYNTSKIYYCTQCNSDFWIDFTNLKKTIEET